MEPQSNVQILRIAVSEEVARDGGPRNRVPGSGSEALSERVFEYPAAAIDWLVGPNAALGLSLR